VTHSRASGISYRTRGRLDKRDGLPKCLVVTEKSTFKKKTTPKRKGGPSNEERDGNENQLSGIIKIEAGNTPRIGPRSAERAKNKGEANGIVKGTGSFFLFRERKKTNPPDA